MLLQKQYGLLDEYLKKTNTYETFPNDIDYLKSKSLVFYSVYSPIFEYSHLSVSPDLLSILGNHSNFEELFYTYPLKVRRPDGKEDFLRRDRKTTEQIYSIIVKDNRDVHDHIMKCLKFEMEHKAATGSLGYMKTLLNWLSDKEWKNYEDVVDDDIYRIKQTLYGSTIE
jgi:hypothetical protein